MSCKHGASVNFFAGLIFAGSYLGSDIDSDFLIDWFCYFVFVSHGIVLYSKNLVKISRLKIYICLLARRSSRLHKRPDRRLRGFSETNC